MKKVLCIKDVRVETSLLHKKGKLYEFDKGNDEGFFNTKTENNEDHVVEGPGDPWFDEHFKLIEEDVVEYKIVKRMALADLSKTNIDAGVFKFLYSRSIIDSINEECNRLPSKVKEELTRLGYLEEVVVDPVVELGDCFEYRLGVYMVCWSGHNSVRLILLKSTNSRNIGSCEGDGCHYSQNKTVLSDLISTGTNVELKDLKPCKINVHVEEGKDADK